MELEDRARLSPGYGGETDKIVSARPNAEQCQKSDYDVSENLQRLNVKETVASLNDQTCLERPVFKTGHKKACLKQLAEGNKIDVQDHIITRGAQTRVNSKLSKIDKITINDKSKIYIKYDYQQNVAKKMEVNDFKQLNLPVVKKGRIAVRYTGCTRKQAMTFLNKLELQKQSLTSVINDFSNFVEGVKTIFSTISLIGQTKRKIDNVVAELISKGKKFLQLLIDLTITVHDICNFELNFLDILRILIDLLRLASNTYNNFFETQSLEALIFAAASMGLPNKFIEVIKRLSLITSVKILDDANLIFEVFSFITDFVKFVISKLFGSENFENPFSSYFMFGSHYIILYKISDLIRKLEKNKDLILSSEIRSNFKQTFNELNANPIIVEWKKTSAKIQQIVQEAHKWNKIVEAYQSSSRKEPFCFVFEGPPGTFKSKIMTQLVESLNKTVYTHSVPTLKEGKDFHDAYNNEEIYVMDDVGQKSLDQYRTIINFVSMVKMPLQCAEAKLKDTKFFNSDAIFLTTNSFMNLNSVCKDDGIADIRALHRRGFVFYFDYEQKGIQSSGTVRCFSYDIHKNKFEAKFPEDIALYIRNQKLKIPVQHEIFKNFSSNNHLEVVAWMKAIYTIFHKVKSENFEVNKLTIEDKSLIEAISDSYLSRPTEIELDTVENLSSLYRLYSNAVSKFNFFTVPGNFQNTVNELESLHNSNVCKLIFRSISKKALIHTINGLKFLNENKKKILTANAVLYWNMHQRITFEEYEILERIVTNEHNLVVRETQSLFDFFDISYFTELMFETTIMLRNEILLKTQNLIRYVLESSNFNVKDYIKPIVIGLCLLISSYLFYSYHAKAPNKLFTQGKILIKESVRHDNPTTSALSSNVFDVSIENGKNKTLNTGLVSGHCVLLPYHAYLEGEITVTIYRNVLKDHRLIDHMPCQVIYVNKEEDIMIVKYDDHLITPFKNMSNYFNRNHNKDSIWLITSEGPVNLNGRLKENEVCMYKVIDTEILLNPNDIYTYDLGSKGMCGSLLFSEQRGILGMHVAGEGTHLGVARVWRKDTIDQISKILNDNNFVLNVSLAEDVLNETSGCKLEAKAYERTPHLTKLIHSPLVNVVPCHKEPANLSYTGPHTIKDLVKESQTNIKPVPSEDLNFAAKVLDSLIEDYTVIDEHTVIAGNEFLAPIDKDASTGINSESREYYINFEEKKFTQACIDELQELMLKIDTKEIDVNDIACKATLKDELRTLDKEGKPRNFVILRFLINVLMKTYTGEMVQNIIKTRHFSGIMIGMNPHNEFENIVIKKNKTFTTDYKRYDKSMLAQVQIMVKNEILKKFKGTAIERSRLDFLLGLLINYIVVANDDVQFLNHSLPSGCFLTALINSLVNKAYAAMWYHSIFKESATVVSFFKDFKHYCFGDDLIGTNCRDDDLLNAISFKNYMETLGLSMTTSKKGTITEPYDELEELTFLKRTFRYHHTIGRVIGPLDPETIDSTMSYVDKEKDIEEVMLDKIHNYQREWYLHFTSPGGEKEYQEKMDKILPIFEQRLSRPIPRLPVSYIRTLYQQKLMPYINFEAKM